MAETTKKCDIVMKGGITSGVVYPPAILALEREGYSFCKIGGTSAGAIAAAATAAAQMGKNQSQKGELPDGVKPNSDRFSFSGLEQLQQELCEPGFIFSLFKPQKGTKILWWLATFMLKHKIAGLFILLISTFLACYTSAALPFLVLEKSNPAAKSALSLLGLLLIVALLLGVCRRFIWNPGAIGFGFTTGSKGVKDKDPDLLCDWLDRWLTDLSGLDITKNSVLTFEDLEEHEVTLRMLTTSLCHHQPLSLPFDDRILLFNQRELSAYFSPTVMKHLVEKSHKPEYLDISELNKCDFFYLPSRQALPVIVATRLSLSFPVLFAAVPLYTIDFSRRTEKGKAWAPKSEDLQKTWFTDGGITSNFPVSMFDSWLPTRPTFAITLGKQTSSSALPSERESIQGELEMPVDAEENTLEQEEPENEMRRELTMRENSQPYLPKANATLNYRFEHLESSMLNFGSTIWSTAQNFRDNMQSILPGSRDRVVEIRLSPNEGGLNLDMPITVVKAMSEKGRLAGEILAKDFEWSTHQWVRLRVLMKELHESSLILASSLESFEQNMKVVAAQKDKLPYKARNHEEFVAKSMERLRLFSTSFGDPDLEKDAPKSIAALQITPRLTNHNK